MSNSRSDEKEEYIFQKNEDGSLKFVGDFEGYYKNENDPWEQTGNSARMGAYYDYSRDNLIHMLRGVVTKNCKLLEIGCGLGHVAEQIKRQLHINSVFGMDISDTAIVKAREINPELEFYVGDITSAGFHEIHTEKYDVLIMNQLLWYILDDLDQVFDNLYHSLKKNGSLVFVNAFMFNQKYGLEKINGFDGLVKYVSNTKEECFSIVEAKSYYNKNMEYIDGILILKKT